MSSVAPEVAPWQAVVHVSSTPTRTCGAVIVDRRHVITAASCLPTVGSNDVLAVSAKSLFLVNMKNAIVPVERIFSVIIYSTVLRGSERSE